MNLRLKKSYIELYKKVIYSRPIKGLLIEIVTQEYLLIYWLTHLYLLDEDFPHPGYSVKEIDKEMAQPDANTYQVSGDILNQGTIINIEIFKSIEDFIAWYQDKNTTINFVTIPAMIDTGAYKTSLHNKIIEDLGLTKIGDVQSKGFGGLFTTGKYNSVLYNSIFKYRGLSLDILGADFSDENYKAILGRDFLKNFTLIYDGWSNTFRLININI